jgi:2,5-dihydroxypyridine 5,6-dioxygenase
MARTTGMEQSGVKSVGALRGEKEMNLQLYQRATVTVNESLRMRPGEEVLVVEDGTLSPRLAEAFVYAAKAAGANVTTLNYQPRHFISMREFGLFAGASLGRHEFGIPYPVLRAMEAFEVVIILNSDMEMLFDQSFLDLLGSDRRMAWIPYIDEDCFLRLFPENAQQVAELHESTTAVGEVFARSREAVVRSEAGTDVRMEIGDYRLNWGTGLFQPGKGYGGLEVLPGGQISTMPNAGTADGYVVIDRSVAAPEFRELLDPIKFTVRDGYVTKIEGGVEARRMERFLASLDDGGEAYHLTELGVGTNRLCQVAAVAGPTEDTHTWGCVSLALGADVHLGGETVGGCHLDMTMRFATLLLDGQTIVEEGQLLL